MTDFLRVCAELAVACGKMRPSGKAAAQKLTTHQHQIVERLIEAHGDDIQVLPSSPDAASLHQVDHNDHRPALDATSMHVRHSRACRGGWRSPIIQCACSRASLLSDRDSNSHVVALEDVRVSSSYPLAAVIMRCIVSTVFFDVLVSRLLCAHDVISECNPATNHPSSNGTGH